jgi:hypothetical protein
VRALDNPSPGAIALIAPLCVYLFSSRTHVWHVATLLNRFLGRLAGIASVSAEVLLRGILNRRPIYHDLIQGWFQKFHVVDLSSAGDYRQRDSNRVDE